QSNMVFRGDSTYYVSGTVNLSGTNILEGATVIKYDTNYACSLNILGTLQCHTAPYHPAVFTSADDASVGEWTGSSSPSLSCTASFDLQVADYTGENLMVSVYDDDGTLVASGFINSGDSHLYTFTAGLGQHFVFDAY